MYYWNYIFSMGFPFLNCSEDVSKRQRIALFCTWKQTQWHLGAKLLILSIFMSFHYKIHLPPSLPIFTPPGNSFDPLKSFLKGKIPLYGNPLMRNSGRPNGPSAFPYGGG